MPDNKYPEKNALIASLPKAEVSDVQKIANNVTSNAVKRRESVKLQQAAQTKVINPSMYDQKIEKLQSYGSKWDNYGYNPNIDNEAFYDKITSDSEQWMRSIKGAGKLAAIGFNDSVLFGAFSNSKKNANEFGKVADIYGTQRGGVTGFAQNLTLNAGYTLGITADMLLEEAALFGISAIGALPSGGSSLVAGGSAMVAKGIKAFGQIGKAFDKMNDIKKAINAVDKVNDISKGRKALNAVGNVLNPIEHTTKYIKALKEVGTVKDLSSLGKLVEGGAAIYRDVKAGQMAVSEAKLEANMLEKDMYDEFLLKNPNASEADMKDFEKRVKDAKFYTMMENTGAIFATNKLVFNNMYKRFDDLKGIGKFVSTGKFGKLAVSGGETTIVRSGNIFQKGFYQGIKDQSKLLFDKGALTALGRIGTTAGSKLGKYGLSNLGEGLQETLQETIQAKNKYQFGNEASGGYFDALLHGLNEQRSGQGFETFASGFLMGGLVNPVTATVTKPIEFFKSKDYKQFTDKQAFNTERERKLSELKMDSDLINEGFKNVGNVYNSMGNTLAAQQRIEKEMIDAVAEGDRHLFQDKKDESFRTHLHTMMKHGMIDDFIKHTEGFKNMDSKQAAAAFGIDENTSPDVINKLINKKIDQAKSFKTRYTKFKQDFQSPVNVSGLKPTDDNYMEQINFHHHWNKAVDDMIFDTAEFEQNLDRKKELLETVKTDAQQYGVSFTDYNVLTSDAEMNKEIKTLNSEIAALSGYETLTPDAKQELNKKQYKLKAILKYQEALGEHTRVLNKIDELQQLPKLNKNQAKELKRLTAHLKRSADRMELRHGNYLKMVHTGEYETPGEKPVGLPKKTRLDHFSKKSFEKLYDYYKLENRNNKLEDSINLLSDPSYLQEHVNRMNKLTDVIMDSHKAFIQNSIAKFRDKEETNKVVKELLDAGVSFDLSELDELIEKGIMPKSFYDIETEEELKQSDPKYKIAQQKLNDLVDNLIEQPILEKDKDIYREVGRGVRINDSDKRTYSDIAKEYGFDVSNERPTSEVLDVIINSNSATPQEKELAKILKKLVPEDAKVVFTDTSNRPNKIENGNSIIDARYASSNYTNSVFSIEEMILKNELQRLTEDSLKNDPVFNAEVKSLRETTINYVNEQNEKNKDDESKLIRTNWKAFDSELDFIKESFGNQSFQALLTRVQAPKKENTIWESLIDAMTKLFGKSTNITNSVYNSIVSVVQAKIDPSTLSAPQQDDSLVENEQTPATTPEVIDEVEDIPETPTVEEFDKDTVSTYPKALLSKLIEAYKKDVSAGDAIGKDADKLSETNLTKEFKNWVDDFGQSIIDDYISKSEEPISDNAEVLDSDNKEQLLGRGFTEEQINEMSSAELTKAVNENRVPTEVTGEEQIIDELIDETTTLETNEKISQEEIPVDTTGEGTSSTDGTTTTQEKNPKQPKSIGANTDLIVVEDQSERPDVFNEWVNQEISGSDGNKMAIAKEIQDLYNFGQSLDANNSEWSIGSFRAQVAGRLIVDVFADGKRFLVYKSIGAGTGIESKGEWTPLFGFAKNGWFVKTNWKGENPKFNKYESTTFKNIDAYLKTAEDSLFSGAQTKPVETVEPVSQPQETTSQAEEFLRTDEEALKKLYFQDSFRTGIHSPKAFLEKLAKEELEKEATANKKLFRKAKAPTKEEISKRAFEMFLDRVKNTKQDNSVFEWRAYDGQGGFGIKYSSDNKTNDMSTVDIRNQKKLHNYTYDETFNSNGVRYVDVKIPIQKSDSTGSNRPSVYTAIVIALPDGMSASEVAEPLIEKAKQLSENRSSINNPTTTKEMVDTLIPIAESIIKKNTPVVQEKTTTQEEVIQNNNVINSVNDLKINVQGSTKNGFEDISSADKSIPKVDESKFLSLTNTRKNNSGYAIDNDVLRVRVNGTDMFGRGGGGVQVSVKLPSNFNPQMFSKLLENIEFEGSTTPEATAKIVDQLKNAIFNSIVNAKTDSQKTTVSKTPRELALEAIKYETSNMGDYYETTFSSTRYLTKEKAEKAVNDIFDKADSIVEKIKNRESKEDLLKNEGYAVKQLVEEATKDLTVEPTTVEKPSGKNATMHSKLVDKLENKKPINAKVTGKTVGSSTGFVMEVDGEKVLFYDHNNTVVAGDMNKKVTLKLVPELTEKGKTFKNVIQVYDGDRFLGNVALTDYDASQKITIPTAPTEEELIEIAEQIVEQNEEVFATPEAILKDLGFTQSDINKLSKKNKMRIVKDKITKEQYVKEQAELKKLKFDNKVQGKITEHLSNKFTGIKTNNDLFDVYDKLVSYVTNELKVKLEEFNDIHLPFVQNIFEQAKLDLANQKDFSTLSVGDKLLLADGRVVKVSKVVNKNSIEVVNNNSIIEDKTTINSKNFDQTVKKVINDFNLKQDDIVTALDQNNLDDLSSILSKFTTQSFAIADEEVTDDELLEHFKACK